MKKLYLVRHAKSSWADLQTPDFDRPLNERGKRDAPEMARRLLPGLRPPDLLITSPARRARETCLAFAAVLGYNAAHIRFEEKLYHAEYATLLQVLQSMDTRTEKMEGLVESAFIFGHNPGLTEFANLLLGISIDNIPTCGVIVADLPLASWADAFWGCGQLRTFDYPKSGD